MASPTRWTWVWVNSGGWWWTGRPGVLQFMGSQRVGHNWVTELTDWGSFLLQDSASQSCEEQQDSFTILPCWVNFFLMFPYSCYSVTKSCLTLCDPMDYSTYQASLYFIISWGLLKPMSIELLMSSNHFILCQPLLLLLSIFPSIKVFSNESSLHIRWPKYWSFSFSISPSNVYSGLISSRIDWFDLLAVQGTLKVFSSTTIWKHRVFTKDLTYKCH